MEKDKIEQAVQSAVDRYDANRAELIPILNDINRSLGYLPREALAEVGQRLKTPPSKVMSVATFYRMLSVEKMGRHVIQFCESAPCHVVGGKAVWDSLRETLEIEAGETTPDGKWTLTTVSCLGICGVGPVMVIDDEVFGSLTPDQIPGILSKFN
ncbi:MAG: NADH-quinone oxidoreductase subunit NuoE [Anaerolineae bacterium]|nr:NADH-quinone oxidoreductase subunit NuoE [Anaerolineae bacterium]